MATLYFFISKYCKPANRLTAKSPGWDLIWPGRRGLKKKATMAEASEQGE